MCVLMHKIKKSLNRSRIKRFNLDLKLSWTRWHHKIINTQSNVLHRFSVLCFSMIFYKILLCNSKMTSFKPIVSWGCVCVFMSGLSLYFIDVSLRKFHKRKIFTSQRQFNGIRNVRILQVNVHKNVTEKKKANIRTCLIHHLWILLKEARWVYIHF